MKAASSVPIDPAPLHQTEERMKRILGVGENGRPFLDYLLYNARRAGLTNIVIVIGVQEKYLTLQDGSVVKEPKEGFKLLPRYRRVVTEARCVEEAVKCFEANDLPTLGDLMNALHASCRGDDKVSCEELDVLVELALRRDAWSPTQRRGLWGMQRQSRALGACAGVSCGYATGLV